MLDQVAARSHLVKTVCADERHRHQKYPDKPPGSLAVGKKFRTHEEYAEIFEPFTGAVETRDPMGLTGAGYG